MSKVKFELNRAGVRELLKSAEVQNVCLQYANAAAGRARASSDGYVAEPRNYPESAGAAVRADTYEARKDNYDNNTLLKSLGGGK